MLNRRGFLAVTGGLAAVSLTGAPAIASGVQGRKLVMIILRGAWDGLNVVAPIGDPQYRALRGEIALTGGHDAGNGFIYHSALENVAAWHQAGQARWLHAAATPYRDRSHFDGQNVLETGQSSAYVGDSGWLNRALLEVTAEQPTAISPSMPLILRGDFAAANWSPSVLPQPDADVVKRLQRMYQTDMLLGPALQQAIDTDLIIGDAAEAGGGDEALLTAAGKLLAADGGADLVVAEIGGWDTHAFQGGQTGSLANRLASLDEALGALRAELGSLWADTVIVASSEFGRTAAVNGTSGTDHGTGGLSLVLGGALKGQGALGDWPGLDDLYEDRDLRPANDLRSLFKGVLRDHWGVSLSALNNNVFPGSAVAAALTGFIA